MGLKDLQSPRSSLEVTSVKQTSLQRGERLKGGLVQVSFPPSVSRYPSFPLPESHTLGLITQIPEFISLELDWSKNLSQESKEISNDELKLSPF